MPFRKLMEIVAEFEGAIKLMQIVSWSSNLATSK
jgi:hypothetical protein